MELEEYIYELERVSSTLTMTRYALHYGHNDYVKDGTIDDVLLQIELTCMDVIKKLKDYSNSQKVGA